MNILTLPGIEFSESIVLCPRRMLKLFLYQELALHRNQTKRILGVPIFQSDPQVNYIDSLQKLTTKKAVYFWFIRKRNVFKRIYANRRAELF